MEEETSKPPQQISEMFQKFALAFKSKTQNFFTEDENENENQSDDQNFTLLFDSNEEFIPNLKVVAIKKSFSPNLSQTLISTIFSSLSGFESSYLVLQTAYDPFNEENVISVDKILVQHLQRLSQLKQFYKNPCNENLLLGSCLEAEVQENQSKLRGLETAFNRLQSEIDEKGDRASKLRDQLGKIRNFNAKLSKTMGRSSFEIVMTVRVFESLYREACRYLHDFSKVLISLMRKAEWDLDLAANSVYFDVNYKKKGHNCYAFLSYVSLCLFRGFDLERFGLDLNNNVSHDEKTRKDYLKELVEHLSCNTMEILSSNPACEFSRFCERKYRELVNSTMESSIFANFDEKGTVMNSWKSLSSFYESYVKMASSIWLLHKMAFSFEPKVEIFQVEKGTEFSMVYMEDVTKKGFSLGENRSKVEFTVIPGFKIGKTVVQSRVYLGGI